MTIFFISFFKNFVETDNPLLAIALNTHTGSRTAFFILFFTFVQQNRNFIFIIWTIECYYMTIMS